jgi:hypothetical protein
MSDRSLTIEQQSEVLASFLRVVFKVPVLRSARKAMLILFVFPSIYDYSRLIAKSDD